MFRMAVVQILKPAHFIAVHHVDYDKDRYDTQADVLNFINGLYNEENNKDEFKVLHPLTIDNNIYYLIMIKNLNGVSIYSY